VYIPGRVFLSGSRTAREAAAETGKRKTGEGDDNHNHNDNYEASAPRVCLKACLTRTLLDRVGKLRA